jgi:hypothetical protein
VGELSRSCGLDDAAGVRPLGLFARCRLARSAGLSDNQRRCRVLAQPTARRYVHENSTLIVNPCNSPEHSRTTFGCAHYQQLIHQVFNAVLSISSVNEELDTAFVTGISSSLARLDKGFHVGDWGQIKEWKLPDSEGYDFITDTHRHLSELISWYPGYSLLLHGRLCKRHYSERRSREAIQPRRGQGR